MVLTGRVAEKTFGTIVERATLSEETNTLVLALALGLAFLVTFYAFFQKGRIKKVAAVVFMPMFFLAMVKTQSRMPMAATLSVPVFALILASRSKNRFKYFFYAIVIIAVMAVGVRWILQSDLMPEGARQRFSSEDIEESTKMRFQYWIWGFQSFVYRPLHGYGMNNFHLIPTNQLQKAAHNTFVALAVDLGLVGLGLGIAIVVMLYRQIIRISDAGLRWLGLAMLMYPLMTGMSITYYVKKDFWYALGIALTVIHVGALQDQQQWYQQAYYDDQYDTDNVSAQNATLTASEDIYQEPL
jgi:O-antigen ligase